MAIGIDPTVDYAFKLLLGSPEHPTITLHFLNAILGNEIQINSVEIINPILGKEDDADKLSILDVAARDSAGVGSTTSRCKPVYQRACRSDWRTTPPRCMSVRLVKATITRC